MLRTSSKKEQQVDHRRFERSINYLLSKVTSSRLQFSLHTDAGSRVILSDAKSKLSTRVGTLTRSDGTESRPDALLVSE